MNSYETENLAKLKDALSKYRTTRTEVIAMVKEGNPQKAYNYFVNNKEFLRIQIKNFGKLS